jgi:ATP-binding cassette subfamily F protein uup
VSHDRDFVNNCVDTCLYFDGTGKLIQIVGGYDDVDSYLAHKNEQRKNLASNVNKTVTKESKQEKVSAPVVSKKKLSYKELRELEQLPDEIDKLESLISELQIQVNQADFFSQDEQQTKKVLNQLEESESKLEVIYARWQELDEL